MNSTYSLYRLSEFINNYKRQDIEINIKTYKEFINVLITIQNFIAKSKVEFPYWKWLLGNLTSKFVLHSNSIITLLSGSQIDVQYFKDSEKKIIDIPSIQVLLRSQLENFLMADFIYFQPKKQDESLFRYYCWDYSSLKSISKYKIINDKLKKIINDNESELELLWEKIESSKYYMKMTKKMRKKLKNRGDSRIGNNWNNLIKMSNLNPILFENFYSILSNNSHSEAFSIYHLKGLKLGYNKNHKEACLLLLLSKSILCLYISRLCNYIKIAEIKLNTFSEKIIEDIKLYSMFIDKKMLDSNN